MQPTLIACANEFSNEPGAMLPSDSSPFEPPTGAPVNQPKPVLSGEFQRRHPISPIINSIDNSYRLVRQAWPGLVVLALRGPTVFASILALVIVVLVAWTTLAHLRFQYRIADDVLTVKSGVFVHATRTLPATRVQQVSMSQKLRHQVFRVVEVGIESAGSGQDPEIKLSVLTTAEAERIRASLTESRTSHVAGDATLDGADALAPPTMEVQYRQPNSALVRWSLANSPILSLIVVAPVFTTVGGFIEERLSDRFPSSVVGVSIALALAAAAVLALGTAVNVLRYYDLQLQQVGDELRLRYGALTQQQIDVPRERIQVLVEATTVPGRIAKVVGVTAHNASGTTGGSNTYLPAVPRSDRGQVTSLLAPGLALDVEIERHPRAALRRAIVRRVVPSLIVVAVALGVTRSVWALPSLALLPLAVLFGVRAWKVLGHAESDDVVVGRSGVWGESTSYVRRERVQSASVAASWTQRRHGLATLRIDVAQPLGKVRVADMARADAERILLELTRR